MNLRIGVVRLAAAASLNLACVEASAEVTVRWPADWQLQRAPMPVDANGVTYDGFNTAAQIPGRNGEIAGGLAVTSLRRRDERPLDLRLEADAMVREVVRGYKSQGVEANCGGLQASTLAELPALEITCAVSSEGVVMVKHVKAIAIGPHDVFSIGYYALADQYDRFQQQFEAIRNSLRAD